jgi:hypothetical protein
LVLEATTSFFSDPDMMMVHHNAILMSANGDDLGTLIWPQLKQEPIAMWMALPPWFNLPGFTQLFRREIAATAFAWPSSVSPEIPNQTLVHDQWVTFISNALGKVGYINEPSRKMQTTWPKRHWLVLWSTQLAEKTTILVGKQNRDIPAVREICCPKINRSCFGLQGIAGEPPRQRAHGI